MILLLDTAANYLNIGIVKNDILVAKYSNPHPRQQSELLVAIIDKMFKEYNLNPRDITTIVLTIGPGSYTGLRIALTFTKVIASLNQQIKVYTLDTLLANAGNNPQTTLVTLDARSNRYYVALVKNGQFIEKTNIVFKEQLASYNYDNLIEVETAKNTLENMLSLKKQWQFIDDIDSLVPMYLKDNNQYGN